ncbi:MAG: membrane protein insertion efficiency factor YidD [Clostridia bacterium]|nr:membrane protein insertion efficiency factor YidD [Clostridia bacterium]
MKRFFIGLIKLYRRYISPLKKPCCRFYPTCSQYAIEAFEEWGVVVGAALSIWRILRCNPFCKGGVDHVPKRNRKHRDNKNHGA